VRKVPALIATAGLAAVALTGCAPAGGSSCTPAAPAGDASRLVQASGDFGKTPKVDFPTPLDAQKTEASTAIAGDGERIISNDQLITLDIALYNGTTGASVTSTGFTGEAASIPQSDLLPGMRDALHCAVAGSRVVAVIPGAEAFGEAGNPAAGVNAGDSVIAVMDVQDVYLSKADGADQYVWESGFPTVVTDENGVPGLTIPKSDPPRDLKYVALKKGDGAKVTKDSTIYVQALIADWKTREVTQSTWTSEGGAQPLPVAQLQAGIQDALVGQTVGSQVLLILPPAEGAQSDSTTVWVIDILGIQ
jgi:peptidylprolyl isomerase